MSYLAMVHLPARGSSSAPIGRDLVEGLAGLGEPSLSLGEGLPAPHPDIDVFGFELQRTTDAPGPLRRDERRAAPGEGIEHDAAALRAVADRIGYQRDRLDRRVHAQLVLPAGPE